MTLAPTAGGVKRDWYRDTDPFSEAAATASSRKSAPPTPSIHQVNGTACSTGSPWELLAGQDFNGKATTFATNARHQATKRGGSGPASGISGTSSRSAWFSSSCRNRDDRRRTDESEIATKRRPFFGQAAQVLPLRLPTLARKRRPSGRRFGSARGVPLRGFEPRFPD